jgi:hypothetical protein
VQQKPLEHRGGPHRALQEIQALGQQAIQIGRRLPLLGPQGDRLDGGGGQGDPVEVLAKELVRAEDRELVHLVEGLVGPLEVDELPLREELEASPEPGSDPPHPFRHGADLPQGLGIEDHDPVRLGQIVAADDDGLGAV